MTIGEEINIEYPVTNRDLSKFLGLCQALDIPTSDLSLNDTDDIPWRIVRAGINDVGLPNKIFKNQEQALRHTRATLPKIQLGLESQYEFLRRLCLQANTRHTFVTYCVQPCDNERIDVVWGGEPDVRLPNALHWIFGHYLAYIMMDTLGNRADQVTMQLPIQGQKNWKSASAHKISYGEIAKISLRTDERMKLNNDLYCSSDFRDLLTGVTQNSSLFAKIFRTQCETNFRISKQEIADKLALGERQIDRYLDKFGLNYRTLSYGGRMMVIEGLRRKGWTYRQLAAHTNYSDEFCTSKALKNWWDHPLRSYMDQLLVSTVTSKPLCLK